jgi:hypothetical protein
MLSNSLIEIRCVVIGNQIPIFTSVTSVCRSSKGSVMKTMVPAARVSVPHALLHVLFVLALVSVPLAVGWRATLALDSALLGMAAGALTVLVGIAGASAIRPRGGDRGGSGGSW